MTATRNDPELQAYVTDVLSMRILVVAGNISASTSMPGSPRLFSLCRELSRSHELHLATRCLSQERFHWFSNDDATRGIYASITILPNPPSTVAWWARQRHRLHRAVYFESQYLHPDYHRQICRTIRALATKEHVSIIYVDGPEMSQYVESDQTLPAFIDVHDSLTLLCTRMMKAETQWRKKCALYLLGRGRKTLDRRRVDDQASFSLGEDAGDSKRGRHRVFHVERRVCSVQQARLHWCIRLRS